MSQTFSLVCHEKRKRVWIGQGANGVMSSFYSGNSSTMTALHRFLADTAGSPIELICDNLMGDDVALYAIDELCYAGATTENDQLGGET